MLRPISSAGGFYDGISACQKGPIVVKCSCRSRFKKYRMTFSNGVYAYFLKCARGHRLRFRSFFSDLSVYVVR